MKYLVHASYLEIYNEEIRDLLGKDIKRKLDLKEPVMLHLPRVQPTYKKVLNPPPFPYNFNKLCWNFLTIYGG